MELLQGTDLTKLITLGFVSRPTVIIVTCKKDIFCSCIVKIIFRSSKDDALTIYIGHEGHTPVNIWCLRRSTQRFNHHGEDVASNHVEGINQITTSSVISSNSDR